MNIPSEIRAGDTVKWRDNSSNDVFGNEIKSDQWTLKYYLRTNVRPGVAHTSTGSAYSTGWEFTISATDSSAFDAGNWYWQAIANKSSEKLTLGAGQLEVLAALEYSGTPAAYDGRTQAQIDLDAVQAAIRSLISNGAKQYSIGGRSFTKLDLPDLMQRETKLKAEVKREQTADLIAMARAIPTTCS